VARPRSGVCSDTQHDDAALSAELREEVLAYHQAHLDEGYRRMANGLAQAHNGQKVISYTKVREVILADREAHSAPSAPPTPPAAVFSLPSAAVHAPRPDQTIHVDRCVVPVVHDGSVMVSVSLSAALAGALPGVDECPAPAPECPGRVFEDSSPSYSQQMRAYAEKRTAKRLSKGERKHRRRQKQAERAELRAQSDELHLQRRQEDTEWKAKRQAQREAQQAERRLSRQERRAAVRSDACVTCHGRPTRPPGRSRGNNGKPKTKPGGQRAARSARSSLN